MSITIREFEWDEYNVAHLEHSHPDLDLEQLEDIVRRAKRYVKLGKDRLGHQVYGARRSRLVVRLTLRKRRAARIFSVRELW